MTMFTDLVTHTSEFYISTPTPCSAQKVASVHQYIISSKTKVVVANQYSPQPQFNDIPPLPRLIHPLPPKNTRKNTQGIMSYHNPNWPNLPPAGFQFNPTTPTFYPQSFLPTDAPVRTYQPTYSNCVASPWVVQPSSGGWGGYAVTGLNPAGRHYPPASWPAAYPNPNSHPGPYR